MGTVKKSKASGWTGRSPCASLCFGNVFACTPALFVLCHVILLWVVDPPSLYSPPFLSHCCYRYSYRDPQHTFLKCMRAAYCCAGSLGMFLRDSDGCIVWGYNEGVACWHVAPFPKTTIKMLMFTGVAGFRPCIPFTAASAQWKCFHDVSRFSWGPRWPL